MGGAWGNILYMSPFIHQLVIITGILLIALTTTCSGQQHRAASACFRNTQKSLHIDCGSGYMLHIHKTFYGYSYSGACSYRPGDCTEPEHQWYPCIGSQRCSFNLSSANNGRRIPSCNKDSQYFQVEYSCVPVIQTTDLCRVSNLTAQSGYISSPNYPQNYQQNTDCMTTITVLPFQKINLTIIDMELEINGTYGCHDWMYAFNTDNGVTLCGHRGNERLAALHSNQITIRFISNKQGTMKGFWLYYEAYPPLPTTQPPVTTKKAIITRRTTPSRTITPPPTIPVKLNTHQLDTKSEENLPFGAIVGGVIGTLTLILIVLLVLLAVKWWRERTHSYKRSPKDVEYLDARNPAFRSSTGNEFQGIEIYYNC